MTRKITLGIVLIALLIACYSVLFGKSAFVRSKVASISELESDNKKLNTKVAQLDKLSDDEFEKQKEELAQVIEKYKTKKTEYEDIVEQYTAAQEALAQEEAERVSQALLAYEESELKDIYDVDFLWTIVGNYATEEGIDLKFDVNKNTTSASAMSNKSSNYIVADLKFIITGSYINLTDFIYDLEDDDRLNFEINNFEMQKEGSDLQVTLTVEEIKVNADNLIDTSVSSNVATSTSENLNDTATEAFSDGTNNSVPVQSVNSSSSTNDNTTSSETTNVVKEENVN